MKRLFAYFVGGLLIAGMAIAQSSDVFDGVTAVSGEQCVDLAKRWIEHKGFPRPTTIGNGNGLCRTVEARSPRFAYLTFYKNGGSVAPEVGDLIGWDDGDLGHIGIVMAVSEGSITVFEQNWPGGFKNRVGLTREGGTYKVADRGKGGTYRCQGWCRFTTQASSTSSLNASGRKVALILDCSASIEEQGMTEALKRAGESYLESLGDQDQATVVTFQGLGARVAIERQPKSEAVSSLKSMFASFDPGGETHLEKGLALAHSLFDQEPNQGVAFVLVSDGKNSCRDWPESLEPFQKRHWPVHVVRVGNGGVPSQTVLKTIASQTGGRYYDGQTQRMGDTIKHIFSSEK